MVDLQTTAEHANRSGRGEGGGREGCFVPDRSCASLRAANLSGRTLVASRRESC